MAITSFLKDVQQNEQNYMVHRFNVDQNKLGSTKVLHFLSFLYCDK